MRKRKRGEERSRRLQVMSRHNYLRSLSSSFQQVVLRTVRHTGISSPITRVCKINDRDAMLELHYFSSHSDALQADD